MKQKEERWLGKQSNRTDKTNWIKRGLIWGVFMFLIVALILPYYSQQEISKTTLVLRLILWIVGGLIFGYLMELLMNSGLVQRKK